MRRLSSYSENVMYKGEAESGLLASGICLHRRRRLDENLPAGGRERKGQGVFLAGAEYPAEPEGIPAVLPAGDTAE